jgi:hypothetical protein
MIRSCVRLICDVMDFNKILLFAKSSDRQTSGSGVTDADATDDTNHQPPTTNHVVVC